MLSPRRIIPPAITLHNIPRRPRRSRRSPGLILSSKSQGVHHTLTSSCASPMRRRILHRQPVPVASARGDVFPNGTWLQIHPLHGFTGALRES